MRFIFEKDTWQEIYDSIRKNKGRTAITIFGAFWGILLLVGLLGAAKGIENSLIACLVILLPIAFLSVEVKLQCLSKDIKKENR